MIVATINKKTNTAVYVLGVTVLMAIAFLAGQACMVPHKSTNPSVVKAAPSAATSAADASALYYSLYQVWK